MPFRAIRRLEDIPPDFGPCAVTIGNFDGVHAGHRELMRRVVTYCKRRSAKPTVLTFDPHPSKVVAPQRVPHLLTNMDQRLAMIRSENVEQVLVLPFTAEIAKWSPEQFVTQLLVEKLRSKLVVVGENFRFGSKAAGDATLLRELGERHGFAVEAATAVKMRDRVVSSSEIRKLIGAEGDVGFANRMLGRPYGLEGRVVSGHGVGSKQTVPTLNLETDAEILPAVGVYITHTWDMNGSRRWNSISNVGYRPTFGESGKVSVETYLLSSFDGETPAEIRVEFLQWVREERKFASPEALKRQIMSDVRRANAYFVRKDTLRS